MKKRVFVLLMILICMCFAGCTRDEEVSSLSKYEMVFESEKNCQNFI